MSEPAQPALRPTVSAGSVCRVHTLKGLFSLLFAQTTPRGRGAIVLFAVVLLCAIGTRQEVVFRATYFLALVIGGSYVYLRLRLRGLDMRMRDKSYAVQVGGTLKVQAYLCNNSRLQTGWVEIVLMTDMPNSVSGIATAIAGRGQERLEVHISCHARGLYTIGPFLARSGDPLGLFRVETERGDRAKVVVHPPIITLPYFRLPVEEWSGEESTRCRAQSRTPHVGTVREYIYGDSLSQIHWLSTARRGQLISKEFDSGGGGDVWIVVDLERRIHYSQGRDRTDEYAVAIAASLAHVALREEHSVGLIAYGDHEYVLPLNGGSQQMPRVLETLILSKTEGDNPVAQVLAKNYDQFGNSSCLLVVTASTDTEWMSVLRELRFRSLNIAVVLVDPQGFGGKESLDAVTMELVSAGIPAYVVRRGDAFARVLSQPIIRSGLPIFAQFGKPEQVLGSQTHGDLSPEVATASGNTC